MRKLLQNKAVVAGLVVVATVCVVGSFINPPATTTAITAQARVTPSVEIPPLIQYPTPSPLRVEKALADWPRQISETTMARDPFRRIRRPAPQTTNQVNTPPPPTFTVQAISIENGRASAVINRQIVGPGDKINGYVIGEIQPHQVWLSGPAGQFAVPVRPATASPTPGPGTAAK